MHKSTNSASDYKKQTQVKLLVVTSVYDVMYQQQKI